MKIRKDILKVSIDSPAAAGAGTQAKLISKHYNLLQLDTGLCYRYIANLKINEPKKYNYKLIKKKINKLTIKALKNKKLHSIGKSIYQSQVLHQIPVFHLSQPPHHSHL